MNNNQALKVPESSARDHCNSVEINSSPLSFYSSAVAHRQRLCDCVWWSNSQRHVTLPGPCSIKAENGKSWLILVNLARLCESSIPLLWHYHSVLVAPCSQTSSVSNLATLSLDLVTFQIYLVSFFQKSS